MADDQNINNQGVDANVPKVEVSGEVQVSGAALDPMANVAPPVVVAETVVEPIAAVASPAVDPAPPSVSQLDPKEALMHNGQEKLDNIMGKPKKVSPWFLILVALGLICLIGGGAYWWMSREELLPSQQAVKQTAAASKLAGYFDQENYGFGYRIYPDSSTDVAVFKHGNDILIQEKAVAYNVLYKDGIVYLINNENKSIMTQPSEAKDVMSYLLVAGVNIDQPISRGKEEVAGMAYDTELFEGVTAYYDEDGLELIKNNTTGTYYQILTYTSNVDEALFNLPEDYTDAELTMIQQSLTVNGGAATSSASDSYELEVGEYRILD